MTGRLVHHGGGRRLTRWSPFAGIVRIRSFGVADSVSLSAFRLPLPSRKPILYQSLLPRVQVGPKVTQSAPFVAPPCRAPHRREAPRFI